MEDFSRYLIKDYDYWSVNIHPNQAYLGRCVIWCKRADALDLTDATREEGDELFLILKSLRKALVKAFRPDWFNYGFLGNETKHLHGHCIPRYAQPRMFDGVQFADVNFGHLYNPITKIKISDSTANKIIEKIKEGL